jgi:NAD(P)-dependent dehydrogenase (short-subunit alcohol dehydrogenase family)
MPPVRGALILMRILLVGATGTIGSAVASALAGRHELIAAGRKTGERVDIADLASVRALYQRVGRLDAVVCAAGQAAFKPLSDLQDGDFSLSLTSKLMGQVNLVRCGLDSLADAGSFTLTGGFLAQHPEPGSAAVSLVNAGLEGFVRAASLEAPRGIRINVVSPPWVTETLEKIGRPVDGGLPASVVARAYVKSIEGRDTGQVISPSA